MPNTTNTAPAAERNFFSTRKFGVEIECVNIHLNVAREILRRAGVLVANTGNYTHAVTEGHWKVVEDGSVHGDGGGCEVVSPILDGEDGIAQVRKVARALARAGATVNLSCGLHVHVDARDLTVDDCKNVAIRYGRYQTEINAFMPVSRRQNDYARCMTELVSESRFRNATSKYMLAQMNRYHAVNLAALERHSTLEFRQHSGSVNAAKIENWVRFCVSFVEASRTCNVNAANVTPRRRRAAGTAAPTNRGPRGRRPLNNNARLYWMFVDAGWSGLRTAAIAAAFGWTQASVAVAISQLRTVYGCRISAVRGQGRYRMVSDASPGRCPGRPSPIGSTVAAPVATPTVTISAANDSLWTGMTAALRSFYEERAMDLSQERA